MSYLALATDRFAEVVRFYGEELGFATVQEWDRDGGRGRRFDIGGGTRLEILDNTRERRPLSLGEPGDRVHVVVEVADVDAVRSGVAVATGPVQDVSWGARLFAVRDPDGVPVTFLQWHGAAAGANGGDPS